MLTYATQNDFLDMKDAGRSGVIVIQDESRDKIDAYLRRATRYIDRYTRRQFFPWVETRNYPVPYSANDLSIRRYPSAHLKLDADLLEVLNINNGVIDLESDDYFTLEHNIYPKTIVAVKFPNYWGGLFGGTSPFKRYDEATAAITAIWGYADYGYPQDWWIDTTQSVADSGGIDDSQTTIDVANGSATDDFGATAFVAGRLIRIDNELMEVSSISSNTLTVIRGIRGSTAVAHAESSDITRWRVSDDIQEACLKIAKVWREADIAAGGRLGVSDYSAGVEVAIPADPLAIIKSYQRSLLFG